MDFSVIIPARYASSRLPAKLLEDINGKSLIERTYLNALQSSAKRVIIATDDERINSVAKDFSAEVCMTSINHTSGTSRLGEGIVVAGDLDGDPWRWQRIRHVEGTLEVASVDRILPAGPLHRLANALRRTLGRGTAPLPPEQASLLTGLVLGDDRAQDGRTADDFRAAGLGHLLAVSGQNVALVVAAAGPLLRRLRFRTRLPTTFLLLAFFALVTRFEPSVLRATVMAGGSATIAARGREADGLRLLSLTVVGLLLVDPLLVHRAAFQLSVAACAGILLGSSTLADLLPGPRPLREAAAVTLAAQSAVAPLLLLLFGPVPVAALPANLLAAPVAGPLMVWGLTGGLLAGVVGPPLDGLLHLPSGFGLGWIGGMAAWAGRHPIGLLGGPADRRPWRHRRWSPAPSCAPGARPAGRATWRSCYSE